LTGASSGIGLATAIRFAREGASVAINYVNSQRFPFQEFEKGFEAMRSGASGKVILDWTGA
jgi:NAD(P)-dependent dehydrogenase (short-subunit alcohol dehydrogenase family)